MFVRHRVNLIQDLHALPKEWGVEIDVRSRNGRLILNHEPHADGDSLEAFLVKFKQFELSGPLIVNTKEDGHEHAILALLRTHDIKNFFFLDTALPTMVRLAVQEKMRHLAVRVSEYEPYELAARFKGVVKWIWLDCFSGKPPALALVKKLRKDFRVCLVSPELQGYPPERIAAFRALAPFVSAVCSKHPALWLSQPRTQ